MKPYRAEVEVTTKYSIEVHAENETEATQHVEDMSGHQIEDGGDFIELVGVEVVDIEPMEPDDDEEDEPESYSDLDVDIDQAENGVIEGDEISKETVIMPEDENDHSDQT